MNQDFAIIKRTKFSEDLSRALKKNKIIYIGAHTGWGKTTAVRGWLDETEQQYEYASACDEDFTEKLCSSAFSKAKLVVLDDLFMLTETDDINALVEYVASANCKFVLISRTALPPYLKPFVITHQLAVFGMKELAFSLHETKELFCEMGITGADAVCQEATERMLGWPLSLNLLAIRLRTDKYSNDIYNIVKWDVFDFFDATLFQQWDTQTQEFLMDICEFEQFGLKLVTMATGKRDAEALLKKILSIGGFIDFTPPDDYKIIPKFFRDYLLKKRHELCSEDRIKRIYQNSGLYYELEDDLPSAMEYYSKAGNMDKLSALLTENSDRHATNAQFYETEQYYRSLPENLILRSPELMSAMSMMESLCCHPEESEKWYDCLEQFKNSTENKSSLKIAREKLLYLNIALPHRGSMNILDLLCNATEICRSGKLILQEISITGDMPSLMNGGKDFTEWTRNDRKVYSLIKMPMEIIFKKCGVGLAEGAMGENLLEKADTLNFTDALSYLNTALSKAMLKGTMQMQFAIVGIMARAFIAQGSLGTARSLVDNFKARCISEKKNTFLANINALNTRMNMLCNNTHEIEHWMQNDAPDELKSFYVLSRYQYLTKVRGYILNEKYLEAASLLNLLKIYYESYGRPYGVMETQLLYAIVLYRMNDERFKEEMTAVVKKCEDYKFFRLIADEGIAAFELLKKMTYDGDKKYFNTLLDLTRQQAIQYPNYLTPEKKLKNELSPPEKTVLQLIVQGKSNNEIADFLDITVRTVKFHITNIYAKLEVTSRSQAIKAATELKLV